MADQFSDKKLILTETQVPDIFLVQYAFELSHDALHLYLWLIMNHKYLSFEEKELNDYQYLTSEDRNKAMAELITRDLIIKKDSSRYLIVDLRQKEVDEYVSLCIGRRSISGSDLDSLKLSADERARNVLAESISATFYQGRMPYAFYRLIDRCLYEYKMDSRVVYSLFEEGRKRKIQFLTEKMREMADDWSKRGISDQEHLNEYLTGSGQVDELITLMGKLSRKRLNGIDIERIGRWVHELHVSTELVEYAFRCNEFRGNITLKNVEDKLTEWISSDIRSLDKAAVYENERKNENKKKSSVKRSRTNTWKTGSEAGITVSGGNKAADKGPGGQDADDADDDPILGIFGGVDEND